MQVTPPLARATPASLCARPPNRMLWKTFQATCTRGIHVKPQYRGKLRDASGMTPTPHHGWRRPRPPGTLPSPPLLCPPTPAAPRAHSPAHLFTCSSWEAFPESQHLPYSAQAHSGCSIITMKDHCDPGDLLKIRDQWRRFISIFDLEKPE